jgi:hypothetical protein
MEKKIYIDREKVFNWYKENRINDYILYKLNPHEHPLFILSKINVGKEEFDEIKLDLNKADFLDFSNLEIISEDIVATKIINLNNIDFSDTKIFLKILDKSWLNYK